MRPSARRAALVVPLSLLPALPLVACGGSSSTPDAALDAPLPDAGDPFGCLGKPLPGTAPAMITISGVAEEITANGSKALVGTSVDGFKSSGGAAIASTVTAGTDAAYALSIATGGSPL